MKITERYSRNILINQIGEKGQEKLLNSSVLVAGAGGLGSGVIAALASLGVGKIGIIDNDYLELSNLNRQFIHQIKNIGKKKTDSAEEWIKSYNPDIKTETYTTTLKENTDYKFFNEYDLVMDCFDTFKSKFLLCQICINKNIPFVHGGVTEFSGQVTTIIPGKSACLNCLFPEPELDAYITKGVISPSVNIISSLQAMEAAKTLLGIDEILLNQLLCYDGLKNNFRKIQYSKTNKCPVCK